MRTISGKSIKSTDMIEKFIVMKVLVII